MWRIGDWQPRRQRGPWAACRHGFTIIEVMTGMTVLALAFTAVYAAFGRGLTLVTLARDDTHVAQILQTEIENLRTMAWGDITALGNESEFKATFSGPGIRVEKFRCRRIITPRREDQMIIRLIVTWNDDGGTAHRRDYVTFFTRGGLNDYYTRAF